MSPLVTVVCLCYNHARFVQEALESVWAQTYRNIELIVVDDASTDESKRVIERLLQNKPGITFIALTKNEGNCRAFNRAWHIAKGEFIIDLAADDVLLPERVEKGVAAFSERSEIFGVQFGDAEWIDEEGRSLGFHSDRYPFQTIPQGDVYTEVIQRYFINSPSMMVRRSVFERLCGYDENLAYEDFDFWVRASRSFYFFYLPDVLVKNRKLPGSLSQLQFKRGSPQQLATYKVCQKILEMNTTPEEQRALDKRIGYELVKSLQRGDWSLAGRYILLWRKNRKKSFR
ncbi:MAG: glycosyltransferase [Bacteroidota bacterium]